MPNLIMDHRVQPGGDEVRGTLARMGNAKKKSSGWRPFDKRRPWQEWRDRQSAVQRSDARRDCDKRGLWRDCPAKRCQRVRGCAGDPWRCIEPRRPKIPEKRNGDPRPAAAKSASAPIGNGPAPRVMSAAEAAAAIAVSIAGLKEAGPEE
jgi:hypothetical protein